MVLVSLRYSPLTLKHNSVIPVVMRFLRLNGSQWSCSFEVMSYWNVGLKLSTQLFLELGRERSLLYIYHHWLLLSGMCKDPARQCLPGKLVWCGAQGTGALAWSIRTTKRGEVPSLYFLFEQEWTLYSHSSWEYLIIFWYKRDNYHQHKHEP